MTSPSKRKGNNFEREIVNTAQQHNIKAKRAWGSDGQSLGLHSEVDVVIGQDDWQAQCKIRKRIAKWLKPTYNVDIQIVREDRGRPLVIMDYEDFLDLLKTENG